MFETQEAIMKMTNKEAAEVLRRMVVNTPIPRGDGRSFTHVYTLTAIGKAINLLEKTPD